MQPDWHRPDGYVGTDAEARPGVVPSLCQRLESETGGDDVGPRAAELLWDRQPQQAVIPELGPHFWIKAALDVALVRSGFDHLGGEVFDRLREGDLRFCVPEVHSRTLVLASAPTRE